MGRFTRNDARSIIFNFVSPDVAETVETLYGTDDDLKNLDGHKFYRILMDAKNSTLSDPDTDAVMPVDTNFGAYRIYMYYKGLIWSVAKGTLVSEKLPDNVIATKEDGSLAIIIAGREKGTIWMEEEYSDPFVNINLNDSYYMEQA